MANVALDAMIKRADFAQQTEDQTIELFDKLDISKVEMGAPILEMLRKPDFQRETNHWKPDQVAELIYSFVHGQLIPSLILWKSNSHVFVIDGAHRLSALKAWVHNDYGDGTLSHAFYNGEIPDVQKRSAKVTRRKVEDRVGRFTDLKSSIGNNDVHESFQRLVTTTFTRTIPVQWIQGSQEVAEVSFFKINSQGTPLDKTEELLLRNRKKSFPIAARAIVRAGTGNRYWSKFDSEKQEQVEKLAGEIFALLFQPELTSPIKTLDLPIGGTVSPVDALKMMLDVFSTLEGSETSEKALKSMMDDPSGDETIRVLKLAQKLAKRISGNQPASVGLHPAVYFYNERGRHSRFLFLGVVRFFAKAVVNGDTHFFKRFIGVRQKLESHLIEKKVLINQALANVNSGQRIDRVHNLMSGLLKDLEDNTEVNAERTLFHLGLKGKVAEIEYLEYPKSFSSDTKSAIFLEATLKKALECPICGGKVDASKSVSYDHIIPKRFGGDGAKQNAQMTHPFCNTTVKN